MPVEFRLLGEVEMRVGGRPVDVGHARQRCVLAVLLAGDGNNLTAEQILDRAWSSPPGGGRHTLYSYISRLRQLLAPVDGADLVRRHGGYTLQVDPMSVDLHRFQHWLAEAGTAPEDTDARWLLEQALQLWGDQDAFAHLDTPWLNTFREGLARERYAAELDLADLKLRAGLHAELIPLLSRRAAQHPLDERLRGQLMLALYRSGRTAHALEHYQRLRSHLAEELGVDPGPGLSALHQQVLVADPALTSAPAETAAASQPSGALRVAPPERTPAPQPGVIPRQLPAPPARFTGRTGELAVLGAALEEAAATGETVGIAAISGSGGIGKTWLALDWAYRNLDRFPEGQLFVNMRGFDPVEQPASPYTALRGFLDALGVPSSAVPADKEAQVALYRSVVAGRRLLIVLDNVRDAAQAEPLLPGSPSCTALVTSRHRLTGLVTAHGARPVPVDVLGEAEARQLLDRHLGPARPAAEPQAVADLLAHCSGLPLALGILAARAVLEPRMRLADLADEVRHSTDGLDVLDTGELRTSLRAVFASSHQALSARTAEAFGLLGLAPGPDIGLAGAAALTAWPAPDARTALRELEAMSLIHQHMPGRWRMHDLVRLYAAQQARHKLPREVRHAALQRLTGFLLHTSHAAERLLAPHRPPVDIGAPAAGCCPLPLADQDAALRWFTAEHPCLLAVQRLALESGWTDFVWQLAWSMDTYHYRRGDLLQQLACWRCGLAAARHADDPVAQSLAHRVLGHACARTGRQDDALDHLRQALALAERAGDPSAEAHTHQALAVAWGQQGDDRRALHHAENALRGYQTLKDPVREADSRNDMGWYAARLGQYAEAREHCEAALALFRHHQHRDGQANTLDSLGYLAQRTGRHRKALEHYQQALTLLQEIGNTYDEADTLDHLGDVHTSLHDPWRASAAWRQALRLYEAQDRQDDADRIRRRLAAQAEEQPGATVGPVHDS